MGAADQSAGMRLARWSAVVIIIAVGAAAFRLSFATLKDLAVLAHIPASDAWLFPLIVDGTILLATFGVLVLANAPERRFFVTVLVIGSVVSVAGNSLHAVAAGRELPWWASALVAAIAPISLLADTHGLALLIRAAQRDSASEPAPAVEPAAEQVPAEPEREPEPMSVPEPEPESLPVPEPLRVAELRPVPAAPVQIPVRSSRPVQTMLPIAVPVGG
ncbi:DUF2637 domain-containing protein [Nocardia abscessus]|uniref:DUF2637 domain-containing protein n=1 Tax=Nocardia abscessus TaxID=120957 RepID=UPI002454F04E|nr:DUF2637 domain-containing protein [Nocardia abscessus]